MKRLGFVGVVVEDRKKAGREINRVLGDYSDMMLARVGIPDLEQGCSVITLVVRGSTDEIGALTGRLGMVEGVSVRSALSRKKDCENPDTERGES